METKEKTFLDYAKETVSNPDNEFTTTAKSSVKLIKNSRGINFEIKVVAGEEHLIEGLREKAIESYNILNTL